MRQSYCVHCDFTYYDVEVEGETLVDCPTCKKPLLEQRPRPARAPRSAKRGYFMHGVYVLLLLHCTQLLWLAGPDGWVLLWFIGITQVVYVVPAAIVMLVQGKFNTLGGLLAAAVATAVLNFALAGLLCGGSTY